MNRPVWSEGPAPQGTFLDRPAGLFFRPLSASMK